VDRFFDELAKDSGLAVYGLQEVMDSLKSGNVELLLISEEFDWVRAGLSCPKCGFGDEKTLRKENLKEEKCPKCGSGMESLSEKELMDEIIKLAEDMSTEVEMISVHTQKGEQLKELGGIGGILRYRA